MDIALPPPDPHEKKPIAVEYGNGLSVEEVAELVRRIREGEEGVLDPLVRQFNDLVVAWQLSGPRRADHF